MTPLRRRAGAFVLVMVTSVAAPAAARQPACLAPMPPVARNPNIFTPAQERDLGDAIAERTQRDYRIIDDAELRSYLEAIGRRLTAHLPATDLPLTFHLIELPEPNAFVLPGRVYVSRKLIAFARSEDELAGVMAHEIGHLLARQLTARMTELFKDVLGVTAVGDREDTFGKYKQLVDALARNPKAARPGSMDDYESDQSEADRLGIFLVTAAGYDSEAFVTFFERILQLNDQKGGFFSDLFGRTSPDVKRLRPMAKTQMATAKSCVVVAERRPAGEFERWQGAVVAYTGRGTNEALVGVVSRTTLTPPLQSDLISLRFSPDGRYLLAQDAASLTVLTRDPFKAVFTVDAPASVHPTFSPDSRQVVFHTPDLRVQVWDIAERRLQSARDVVAPGACVSSDLSPDGRFLACLDAGSNLALYDVNTSERVLERKEFFKRRIVVGASVGSAVTLNTGLNMEFSPDGRFFVVGYHDEGVFRAGVSDVDEVIVYDLAAKAPIELNGTAKKLLAGGFTFTGPDRLLALNFEVPAKSAVVALPAGNVVRTLTLSRGRFDGATDGPFALYRPFQKYAVAIFDFDKGSFVKTGAYPAVDLYRDVFVAERSSGELALYALDGNRVLATTTLPSNTLGRLRTAVVSPDLKRLALSGAARGGLWDLTTGQGIAAVPAFAGGHVAADGQLYIDVQPLLGLTRQMARVDLGTGQVSPVGNIGEGAAQTFQVGGGVLSLRLARPEDRMSRAVLLEMRDSTSLTPLWTQTFATGAPRVLTDARDRHVLYLWPTVPADVRTRLKDSPAAKKLQAVEAGNASLLEIWDVRTGAPRGALVVDARPSSLVSVDVVGNDLVVSGTDNRVVVYAIASGETRGQVFGRAVVVSPRRDLLLVENGTGRLVLYDYLSLQRRGEFSFRRGVAVAEFNDTSTEMLVLTYDQSAARLAVPAGR